MNPLDELEEIRTQAALLRRDVEALQVWRVSSEQIRDAALKELREVQMTNRELKTNWKLAAAVGGFGGSLMIALILAVATLGK